MRAKNEKVNFHGLHTAMFPAMFVADDVCRAQLGYEMIVTSARDGHHSNTSRHYAGLAWDMRTWTTQDSGIQIGNLKKMNLVHTLQEALPDFFVLGEKDHIHISYKPKR